MSNYTKLASLIREIAQPEQTPLIQAIVKSIEGETCTVALVDIDGKELLIISDVMLKASTDSSNNTYLRVPAVGSVVLLGSLSNDLRNLSVLNADEICRFEWKSGDLTLVASADGLQVENKGENLKTALVDLITEIQKIVVPNGTSPNVPALEAIKQRLNKILV